MNVQRFITWLIMGASLLVSQTGCQQTGQDTQELVNVSYDPTRELYQEVNAAFVADYHLRTGKGVKVTQSHGGSGSQARAVIDGLKADVVTLALGGDIDEISRRDLIEKDWASRLPQNACPYYSTIVFLVRKGNPKQIKDWQDLVRPGVGVITPNPKTSGGARWNFLAAWGFVTLHCKQDEAAARAFVQMLYANVIKLDTGARGATETFLRKKQGDVLIAWENEARLAREQFSRDGVEIVYPSVSIKAEPPVAVVDRYAQERGTTELARAYLQFLYTDAAQQIIARHGYRPASTQFQKDFPELRQFTVQEVTSNWETAQQKFFSDGSVFDQIYQPRAK